MITENNKAPVRDFAPLGFPHEQALQYPFSRPEGNFLTDGENVYNLPKSPADFFRCVDDLLTSRGLPTIAERIPVLAYGSNCNPFNFSEKMARFGQADNADMQTVPMIEATIPGVEIVWHGKPGMKTTFAEIYADDKTADSVAKGYIQYLTVQQLASMSTNEGMTYELRTIPVKMSDGTIHETVAYVASDTTVLVENDRPIKVAGTDATSDSDGRTKTNEEAIAYMLQCVPDVAGTVDPRDFTQQNMPGGLPLTERQARRKQIGEQLEGLGVTRPYSYPLVGDRVLRAVVDFDPTNPGEQVTTTGGDGRELPFVRLPEQVLSHLRPTEVQIQTEANKLLKQGKTSDEALWLARLKLDIVFKMRQQATNELENQLKKNGSAANE